MRAAAHHAPFNLHPLATLAAVFAAGVFCSRAYTHAPCLPLICGAVCLAAALVALVSRRLSAATLFVLAAFFCAGLSLALIEQQRVGSAARLRKLYEEGRLASGQPLELTGVLARAPEVAPDGLYLALRVERVRHAQDDTATAGAVELFAPTRDAATHAAYEALELRRGARIRVLVRLEREDEYRNPGASSLPEYLERRGLDATGAIKSPLLVERLDDERVLLPLVWLDDWRAWMSARIAQLFSTETAGVLQAALLGERRGLSRDTAERFRAGGTFHVLVISGLHISFIGWLAFVLLRRVTKRRAWQFAATVLLLWAYTVAVGAGASVLRAALMFTLVALAPLVGRRASAMNALGGAALVLLVWRPADLFDPSFQLTFLSVVGIVALGWPLLARLQACGAWRPTRATPQPPACPRWLRTLGELLYWRERAWQREVARTVYSYRLFKHPAAARLERWRVQSLLRYACAAVIISASVQLCLLPLLVIYFHRVSYAALLLNIFVGVLMAALGLVALVALVLSALSLRLAAPLVWLGERINWLMTHSADPFLRAHLAALRLPAYHGRAALIYALYYLPLAALLFALARWQPLAPRVETRGRPSARWLVAACLTTAALLCVIVAHPFSGAPADGRLRIDFLDVGQGDAALITLPDGTTLLVDGGGRPTFGTSTRMDVSTRAATNAGVDARPSSDESEAGATESEQPVLATFTRDGRGIGDAVVSEYLWWRGLDHVDYLLATHADADHSLFNAKNILDRVSV